MCDLISLKVEKTMNEFWWKLGQTQNLCVLGILFHNNVNQPVSSAQPVQPNCTDATNEVIRPASISAISTRSRTSNAADIQNVLNQLNHVGENLGKILENK